MFVRTSGQAKKECQNQRERNSNSAEKAALSEQRDSCKPHQKEQCTENLDKPFLKGGNGCPLGEQSDTDPQKERAAKLSHQQDHCFHRSVHRISPFLFRGMRSAGAIYQRSWEVASYRHCLF